MMQHPLMQWILNGMGWLDTLARVAIVWGVISGLFIARAYWYGGFIEYTEPAHKTARR